MKPNPYIEAKDKELGSAKQLKQQQNQLSPYYPVSGDNPYNLALNNAATQMVIKKTSIEGPVAAGNYPSLYSQQAQQGVKPSFQQAPTYAAMPPPNAVMAQGYGISAGPCQFCHTNAGFVDKNTPGCAIWVWCIVLWLLTGCCCWIPFLVDDCYDRQITCLHCGRVRGYIKSQFCC